MRCKRAEPVKRAAAALIGLLGLWAPALAAEPQTLPAEDQQRLVLAALPQERRQSPGLEVRLVGADPQYPRLVEYMVARPAAVIGYFDVDPRTGDVFQATGCGPMSTPELERLKLEARRKLHLTPESYARRRLKAPYC